MTTAEMVLNGPPVGRHADAARGSADELARRWLREGKLWLLPLLLSDYGRDIVERKYDAISTDRAYANRPSGRLGPVGTVVDWVVLRQSNHVGLRQRLGLVVEEVAAATRDAWALGVPTVRLASAPCGLARDLRLVWCALGAPTGRLELLGLDLDAGGEVLPLAARLAAAEGVPLRTARCDLFAPNALQQALGGRPVDVFLSIGLSPWLDPPDLALLLGRANAALSPGGVLVVDRFCRPSAERFARDLEIRTRYHGRTEFEAALTKAGFAIVARRETRNGVSDVYRCRKVRQA